MEITICIGSSCHLKGSKEVIQILERLISSHGLGEKIQMNGSFCIGECMKGVCVKFNNKTYSLTPSTTEEFFKYEVLSRI